MGDTPQGSLDVSEHEITAAGLYGYVLPESYVKQAGWQQHIWIATLPLDCQAANPWKQVRTFYGDSSGNTRFSIIVSPANDSWGQGESTTTIPLRWEWNAGSTAEATSDQVGTFIRIKDVNGMVVIIGANMNMADTSLLLKKLMPIGASTSLNIDLWKPPCHSD
jgi:hypothetical protein